MKYLLLSELERLDKKYKVMYIDWTILTVLECMR